ncbi:hypothetical protein BJV74DRAFT_887765 [Russula compacta]|nr:hypothetical protein BJV74DRAFT_887765 [Russula compacta]
MPSLHDTPEYLDNILATFERREQASQVWLTGLTTPLLERFITVMQEPFPALTFLEFRSSDEVEAGPDIPNTFLGGSAPSLQFFNLNGIAFPGLLKLLSSAKDLVFLVLRRMLMTGYISSEALADTLSTLPRLKWCTIGYLEDLVAPISAPLLDLVHIYLLGRPLFDTPQLSWFISQSDKLKSPKWATIAFEQNITKITFGPHVMLD